MVQTPLNRGPWFAARNERLDFPSDHHQSHIKDVIMATPSPSQIEAIINTGVASLYKNMPAGSGISAAFYYPANSQVSPYYYLGQANPSASMSEQTIVCVGSITKTFTASLLAYLYCLGKVGDLGNALVQTWLPGVASKTMSLLELATQTSGMPKEGGGQSSDNLFTDQPPSQDLVSWWSNPDNFNKTEGSWVYSNVGFVTLGFAVVAIENNKSFTPGYTVLLEDWITSQTNPQLSSTCLTIPDYVPAKLIATGHMANGTTKNIQDASDIKSTAADMYTWMEANLTAPLASSPSVLQQALVMATNVQLPKPQKPNRSYCDFDMGLAWQIFDQDASVPTIIAKDGATSRGGCSGWVGIVRQVTANGQIVSPAMGIALLLNCDGMDPGPVGTSILQQIAALN
jgi:CubicO group peptidase (beta-lactamase class C family)